MLNMPVDMEWKKSIGLALLLLMAAIAAGCKKPADRKDPIPDQAVTQALLIGLDAAEWSVIDPMIAAGRLPAMKSLLEKGVRAPLKSIKPTHSPVIWTTIATGKTRENHGITDFTVPGPEGKPIPITSNFRKVKALWNMLSDRGLRVGFVNWWPSFPAEKVNGFMVSNYLRYYYPRLFLHKGKITGSLKSIERITYPEELRSTVQSVQLPESRFLKSLDLEKMESQPMGPGYDPLIRLRVKNAFISFKYVVRGDELTQKLALDLLKKHPVDLLGIYFEGIDVASHMFWHNSHPDQFRMKPEPPQIWGGLVEAYYEFSDTLVKELTAAADPRANTIIVSDHGYGKKGHWHDHLDTGVIILSGPAFKNGVRLEEASILDITPTVLYLLGLPVARDMEGRVLIDAFTDDFRAAHALEHIDSYEDPNARREPAGAIPSPLDEDILEKLRALGYVQ